MIKDKECGRQDRDTKKPCETHVQSGVKRTFVRDRIDKEYKCTMQCDLGLKREG